MTAGAPGWAQARAAGAVEGAAAGGPTRLVRSHPDSPPLPRARRIPDLRGNGLSDRPSWWDRSSWWTVRAARALGGALAAVARARLACACRARAWLGGRAIPGLTPALTPYPQVDENLLLDMPTVVNAVLEATGSSQVHWLGHSLGGMLGVGAVSRGLPCARALRTLTLLSESPGRRVARGGGACAHGRAPCLQPCTHAAAHAVAHPTPPPHPLLLQAPAALAPAGRGTSASPPSCCL